LVLFNGKNDILFGPAGIGTGVDDGFSLKLFHMAPNSYTIAFTYLLEDGKFTVNLIADVEAIEPYTLYSVKNLRTTRSNERPVLPDVQLKKHKGRWVHRDSEKESELSRAIGAAIETSNGHERPSGSLSEMHP